MHHVLYFADGNGRIHEKPQQGSEPGFSGMRVGGAYDVRGLASSPAGTDTERGWAADADAVISPARFPVIGPLLGGFLPTVVSGIGVEGVRRSDGTGGQGMVASYGEASRTQKTPR